MFTLAGPSGRLKGALRIRTSVCTGQGAGRSAARGASGAPAGPGGVPSRSDARPRPDARALPIGLAPEAAPADAGVPGTGLDRALAVAPWLGAAAPCASRPGRLLAANARAASCSDAAAWC